MKRSRPPLLAWTFGLFTGCFDGELPDPPPRALTPPPAAIAEPQALQPIAYEPAIEQARQSGRALFFGRAMCVACHKIDREGGQIVGPNLGSGDGMSAPVAVRAKWRRPELTPLEYVLESIVDPDAVVVPNYAKSVMKPPRQLGIELSDEEVVSLAAFVVTGSGAAPLEASALMSARAFLKARTGAGLHGRPVFNSP